MNNERKKKKMRKAVSLHSAKTLNNRRNPRLKKGVSNQTNASDTSFVGGVVSVHLEQIGESSIRLSRRTIQSRQPAKHIKIFVAGGEAIDRKIIQANSALSSKIK